jgi:hypothetical protein
MPIAKGRLAIEHRLIRLLGDRRCCQKQNYGGQTGKSDHPVLQGIERLRATVVPNRCFSAQGVEATSQLPAS